MTQRILGGVLCGAAMTLAAASAHYDGIDPPAADSPAAQRYLLVDDSALVVYPTVSVAVAILKNLSVGVGFVWGIGHFSCSNMAASSSTQTDDFTKDIKSKITGTDGFIPAFIL